jgi:hypothetical protein
MKTTAICALALAGIFAVGFCGAAGAVPYKTTGCHMAPGPCVTKTTVCQPQPHGNIAQGPGKQTPCVPKTYQQCAPAKKVCD